MNYFELFEIPVQLRVNTADISKKYFELSRQYHPDYFVNQADKQAEALEISAQLNKAFKTFQDGDSTIKYVLQSKGLLEEEEKYQLPADFLMEVLEINEQVMDAEDDAALKERLRQDITRLQTEIYDPVKQVVENYQEGITSEKELLQVKEYYYKKKYLDRITRELNTGQAN